MKPKCYLLLLLPALLAGEETGSKPAQDGVAGLQVAFPNPVNPLDHPDRSGVRKMLLPFRSWDFLVSIIVYPSLNAPSSIVLFEKNGKYLVELREGQLNEGAKSPNEIGGVKLAAKELDKQTAMAIHGNILSLLKVTSYRRRNSVRHLDGAAFEVYATDKGLSYAATVTPVMKDDLIISTFAALNELAHRHEMPKERAEELIKFLRARVQMEMYVSDNRKQ